MCTAALFLVISITEYGDMTIWQDESIFIEKIDVVEEEESCLLCTGKVICLIFEHPTELTRKAVDGSRVK